MTFFQTTAFRLVITLSSMHSAARSVNVSTRTSAPACASQMYQPRDVASCFGYGRWNRWYWVGAASGATMPPCDMQLDRLHDVAQRDGCGLRMRCCQVLLVCFDGDYCVHKKDAFDICANISGHSRAVRMGATYRGGAQSKEVRLPFIFITIGDITV